MKSLAALAVVWLGALLCVGCSPAARYEVLSLFFDGVPRPSQNGNGNGNGTHGKETAKPGERPKVKYGEHGPFAAKLCSGCHESQATNALVLPIEQLCFKCHDLGLTKKYIHGPIASGGCKVCHDPHGSRYRYLLVSESDSFCFYCHDSESVAAVAAHQGTNGKCTVCHDPHMSDQKYLLR